MTNTRKPKNKTEAQFCDVVFEKGWVVTKRGWPDFFCLKPDGSIVLVEVKRSGQRLKPAQRKLMEALYRLGVPVSKWSPAKGFHSIWD